MLTRSGVKLLDFGLARVAAGDSADADSRMGEMATLARDPDQPLTAEGTILGTYPYMAPEQVEGAETDARPDIFSLGAVLYEMATGQRAFQGKSAASVMAAVLKARQEPRPPVSCRAGCSQSSSENEVGQELLSDCPIGIRQWKVVASVTST